jgi:hypothetical protein
MFVRAKEPDIVRQYTPEEKYEDRTLYGPTDEGRIRPQGAAGRSVGI